MPKLSTIVRAAAALVSNLLPCPIVASIMFSSIVQTSIEGDQPQSESEVRLCRTMILQGFATASLAMVATVPIEASAQSMIPGYPGDVRGYDPREVGRLPIYCRFTQGFRAAVPGGNDQAQINHWYSVMGKPFHHMHHYCWGLMKLNRAQYLARSDQVRNFYFGSSIQEFDYVLERSPEDFVLRAEILTKKGQGLIGLGRGPFAVPILESAIELKPEYWPAYVQLSDYYKNSGKLDMAREVLEKALSRSPEVGSLKQRLAELDASRGKQSKGGK